MRHLLAALLLLHAGLAYATDEDETDDTPAPPEQSEAAPEAKAKDVKAPAPAPAPRDEAAPAAHREGEYGGVSPEAKGPADAKPGHARKGHHASNRLLVTWVGFQVREGGAARVFVQLSGAATYEQHMVGDALVLFVPGARLGQRNHGRFIDTSFFDTSVARIEGKNVAAKRGQKAGVELTVRFKKGAAKNPEVKEESGPDGHRFVFLDFAP